MITLLGLPFALFRVVILIMIVVIMVWGSFKVIVELFK